MSPILQRLNLASITLDFSRKVNFSQVVDEDIRPSQLSFEMTPKRSGFHWRVEALNASLWSALIHGRRRWGLYPPSHYFVPGKVKILKS